MITYNELVDILNYDSETGALTWKYTRSSRALKGSEAGTLSADGYISISINYTIYRAHRLIWLHCFQEWPERLIDHINGNRKDNRLVNLREVTDVENSYNTKVHKDSCTGIKGVYFNKANNNYRAQIRYNGKTVSLGSYKGIEDAKLAYTTKAKEVQGDFYPKE